MATLRQDELVDALSARTEPGEATVVLQGFLGRAAAAGRWRVYEGLELATYVEVDEADIVHAWKVEGSLGGTILWLRATAQVSRPAAAAAFLAGTITDTFLSQASDQFVAPAVPSTAACITVSLRWCTTVTPVCNWTRGCSQPCPSLECPSRCPTPPGYSVRIC